MHRILHILVVGGFMAACCLPAQNLPVTAVEGESWLNHLARNFNDTSMGKTGRLGPPPDESVGDGPNMHMELLLAHAPQTVTLHGDDLYRLNCQGCHGESGLGATTGNQLGRRAGSRDFGHACHATNEGRRHGHQSCQCFGDGAPVEEDLIVAPPQGRRRHAAVRAPKRTRD